MRIPYSIILIACWAVVLTSNIARCQESLGESPLQDWIRIGKSRYNWKWLEARFDTNHDQQITPMEFPGRPEIFQRIDRDWNGVLNEIDFDWEKNGILGKQKETTFALFKLIDLDSDGRISAEEWQQHFENCRGQQQYLNEEQLEQLIYQPRVVKTAKEESLRKGRTEYSPSRLAELPVPQPGDLAPDFELQPPDGNSTIRLSQFRGNKPVVLIFGCYTCGNYRTYSETVENIYQLWKDDFEFLRVYVREAHPTQSNEGATATNKRAGILISQPSSFQERCQVASKFTTALHISTPMVVDGVDNKVGQDYGAWPDRLFVVDRDGKIAYSGAPGPFGFNPREMEQSLAMILLDQNFKK